MAGSESLRSFVRRLSDDVQCYYHKNPSREGYSLKLNNSKTISEMGVFGWVREKPKIGRFLVTTYEYLLDDQALKDADVKKDNMHFVSADEDLAGTAPGAGYYVVAGSTERDYVAARDALQTAIVAKRIMEDIQAGRLAYGMLGSETDQSDSSVGR